MPAPRPDWEEVLAFWFGPLSGDLDFPEDRRKLWWAGGEDTDLEIRQRFGAWVAEALEGGLGTWSESARGRLALVLLLDQFQRCLGRGTPAAFAGDARALSLCLDGIDCGHDRALRPIERSFLYMPLIHSEDRAVARRCLETYQALSDEIAACGVDAHPDFLSHAQTHADIVLKFGRYPHRNAILGRASRPEEDSFLADGGPSFGQKRS
ncbi:MAG: DUF924 family protein [Myxococcota bacterium]